MICLTLPRVMPAVLLAIISASLGAFVQEPLSAAGKISGSILGDDGVAIGRALVCVTGMHGTPGPCTTSDDSGHFTLQNVPRGPAMVRASRPTYIESAYGSLASGQLGTVLDVSEEPIGGLVVTLSRASVIAGRISDSAGRPARAVLVFAVPHTAETLAVVPRFGRQTAFRMAETDDGGYYRLFDLKPGDYYVVAVPSTTGTPGVITHLDASQIDGILARLRRSASAPGALRAQSQDPEPPQPRLLSVAPVFYPGTVQRSLSVPVEVKPGQVHDGLDFRLTNARPSSVDGTVSGPVGAEAQVEFSISGGDSIGIFGFPVATPNLETRDRGPLAFHYSNVTPGHYVITAKVVEGASEPLFGRVAVDVDAQDLSGLSIAVRRAPRVTATLVFGGTGRASRNVANYFVSLRPERYQRSATIAGTQIGGDGLPSRAIPVDQRGRVKFGPVPPGVYAIDVVVPPSDRGTWWCRSAVVDGADLLDSPLTIQEGDSDREIVLTMTDRHSVLSGRLDTAAGVPAPGYWVLLFADDPTYWHAGSRRVRRARPTAGGEFQFRDVPEGAYQLVVAVALDEQAWQTRRFLEGAGPYALGLRMSDGEALVQNISLRHARY
jgi:hypothetical protein